MRGIICEQIGTFRYATDLPEPILGQDEAVIEIKRVGICGTDLHAYQGNQPFFEYPRILGHELAGIVTKISNHDQGILPGDQVTIVPYLHCNHCVACRSGRPNCCMQLQVLGVHVDGGLCERIKVPISHLLKTEGLSLDHTAMIEPLAIGAHAVRRSGICEGTEVLVIGGGPIGLGVMTLAKEAGANVIAMDVNKERLDFCRSWAKVNHTINAADEDLLEQLSKLTAGALMPIVIDATGNITSMTNAFNYTAHGGTLLYVGLVKGNITFNDPEFHKRELTIMGSRNATKEDFAHVIKTISTGRINLDQYITHRASLEEMANLFDEWLEPESKVIKAVVEL